VILTNCLILYDTIRLFICFKGATHLGHSFDRIYATQMLQYQSLAVISTITTKHKAVIAYAGNDALADKHKVVCKTHFRIRI